MRAASYCVCADTTDANIVNVAKIFILFIFQKIYEEPLPIIYLRRLPLERVTEPPEDLL